MRHAAFCEVAAAGRNPYILIICDQNYRRLGFGPMVMNSEKTALQADYKGEMYVWNS